MRPNGPIVEWKRSSFAVQTFKLQQKKVKINAVAWPKIKALRRSTMDFMHALLLL
jgi:hypothetical protein